MKYYMTTFNRVYANSKRWNGDDLKGKRVIVYCEQGFGDIIQFARYFKDLKCHLILHCPKQLHRLLKGMADEFIDREEEVLPEHDYHILSTNLPHLVEHEDQFPYIDVQEKTELEEDFKIGICWEGNPFHNNNNERSCPLKHFKGLTGKLFCLQKDIHEERFIEGGEDIELYGVPLEDFYDTAMLINSLDLVVSVDTAVAHLAGALNKKTYCLLAYNPDNRWSVSNYSSLTTIKQKSPGDWESVFSQLYQEIAR